MKETILSVRDLHVTFFMPAGEVQAVGGISYDLYEGEVLGIVGESGSGKSVEAYSIMGLLQPPGRVTGGEIIFEGENILNCTPKQMRSLRGDRIGMIFQNPMTCLNPVYTIGNQLTEVLSTHRAMPRREAREHVKNMLAEVGIGNVERRMKQYPHELSGGMRQRVMIAMALLCNPKLLIADEPTTALDVTIQAQILDLMRKLQEASGMAIVFITHNLGVVAEMCDRVAVMYGGRICEIGTVDEIFFEARHPYTVGLLKSVPNPEADNERLIPIKGTPIDMTNIPAGCPLSPRCDDCMKVCLKAYPPKTDLSSSHSVACWKYVSDMYTAERGDLNGG